MAETEKQSVPAGKNMSMVYDMDDTIGVLQQFRPCNYDEKIRILENVEIRFHDIGHLLGSSLYRNLVNRKRYYKENSFQR